jgi:hypothetical protein
MSSRIRELTSCNSLWWIALVIFGPICLSDYHLSISNQIPSDGLLTIGYPKTFYWKVCPMISTVGPACQSGIRASGLVIDLLVCSAVSMVSALLAIHFWRKDFITSKLFWLSMGFVFALTFLLASVVTALHSGSHHGRAINMGFPLVYLFMHGIESFDALNLAMDLAICFIASFLGVASVFTMKSDGPRRDAGP